MTSITIRQSGGANIISLPKAIVNTLGLRVGSKLDLFIEDNKIVLSPVDEDSTLQSLLSGSPKSCFAVTGDDRSWIDANPVGREE